MTFQHNLSLYARPPPTRPRARAMAQRIRIDSIRCHVEILADVVPGTNTSTQ